MRRVLHCRSSKVALKLPLKNPRIVVIKSKRRLSCIRMARWCGITKIGLGLNLFPTSSARVTCHARRRVVRVTKNDKSAFYLSLGISIQT